MWSSRFAVLGCDGLFDVGDRSVAGKSSNPARPEISGNSGVAMANVGQRNRRLLGTCERRRDERCGNLGHAVCNPPPTGRAVFPPLT
jgi:hypothetical protein